MSLMPYFYDLERPFRLMEREFLRPDEFFGFSPFSMARRPFSEPHYLRHWDSAFRPLENLLRPMEQLSTAMNQLALNELGTKVTADDEKFQVNVDVQHFSPDEINVKVLDGNIVIEGKHEEKRDNHGYISRQFVRKYALPKGCLPDAVQSKLSSDGVLTVTAPKVLPLPSTGERIVPITHTGPIQKQIGSPEITEGIE